MRSNKWLYLAAAVVLSMSTNVALAQGNGHGRGHEKHADRDDRREDRQEDRAERHSYREHDRELHDWYRSHYNSLPPGLAKRDRLPPGLERQLVVRGTLPPGLQKKCSLAHRIWKGCSHPASELCARRDRWQLGSAQSGELPHCGCLPPRG